MESNLLGRGDQEAQLDEAVKNVKKEAFEMKRWLDKHKILDALRHATNMLNELKANSLSPKFYYRLCRFSLASSAFNVLAIAWKTRINGCANLFRAPNVCSV